MTASSCWPATNPPSGRSWRPTRRSATPCAPGSTPRTVATWWCSRATTTVASPGTATACRPSSTTSARPTSPSPSTSSSRPAGARRRSGWCTATRTIPTTASSIPAPRSTPPLGHHVVREILPQLARTDRPGGLLHGLRWLNDPTEIGEMLALPPALPEAGVAELVAARPLPRRRHPPPGGVPARREPAPAPAHRGLAHRPRRRCRRRDGDRGAGRPHHHVARPHGHLQRLDQRPDRDRGPQRPPTRSRRPR